MFPAILTQVLSYSKINEFTFGIMTSLLSLFNNVCLCLPANVSGLPGARGVRVTSGGTLWTASVI